MNPISTPSIHENSLAMGSKSSKFSMEKVNIFDKEEEDSLCQEIFEREGNEGLEKAHTARFRESIESFYTKEACLNNETKINNDVADLRQYEDEVSATSETQSSNFEDRPRQCG